MEKLNKILTVAIVVVIVMLGFQSVKFAKNWKENRQTKQEFEFQILSNTNFANVDPNMPEEVLKSQKEKYNQAMEKLKEDPFDFEANMIKAGVLYFLNEYEKAIIIYEKLGELRPKNFLSFKGLGDSLSQLHKFAEAESAYLKTINNNSHELNAYLALAEIYRYHIKDNKEKIRKFYEDGIKNLGSDRFSLIQNYASQLEEWGEYEKALEQWKAVLEEFPDNEAIKLKVRHLSVDN